MTRVGKHIPLCECILNQVILEYLLFLQHFHGIILFSIVLLDQINITERARTEQTNGLEVLRAHFHRRSDNRLSQQLTILLKVDVFLNHNRLLQTVRVI